jgi:hypothetical protein
MIYCNVVAQRECEKQHKKNGITPRERTGGRLHVAAQLHVATKGVSGGT